MVVKKCAKCKKNITKKLPGLECSRCDKIVHADPTCSKLSNKQLNTLRNSPGIEWSCEECLKNVSRRTSFVIPDDDKDDDESETSSVVPAHTIDTRKLVQDISREVKKTFREEMSNLASSMDYLSEQLTTMEQSIKKQDTIIRNLENKNQDLINKNKNLELRMTVLEQGMNNFEQKSLETTLEVAGLPEIPPGDVNKIMATISSKLSVDVCDMLSSQRLPGSKEKPGTILVEMKTKVARRQWIDASKEKVITIGQLMADVPKETANKRVFIREALTKHVKTLLYNTKTHLNESGCEADMLESAEGGRHSPSRPQQEPINLKNEQAESDRESGASSPEGGGPRAQVAEPRTPSPHARTPHQPHLNGSMASMFQNLQNLANMQQGMPMSQQQMSQQMSQLAANLQGLTSMPNPVINSPLNLSVSAPGMGSPNPVSNNNMLPPAMPSPMPQLILASGQLVQGIQGAQLLIPTSQGIATQTILTIPVNHVNSNDQMVNLALNNGQVVSTSLANLQAMAQPHQLLNSNQQQTSNIRPNMLNPSLSNALLNPGLPNFLSNGASNAQELLQALQQPQGNHNLLQTVQQNNMPQQMQGRRSSSPRPDRHYKERENFERFAGGSRERNERENVGATAMNSINRLASSNGEITITTSHSNAGPGSSTGSVSSGPNASPHAPVKMSPGSVKSPSHEENDLLADSPNQPTISQSSGNVVDGINLEDIKEFAKAFKLRRLGLGLTQTQVGQALSVTEGPAYSQSAICSALASQMLAAQLSSQQQNIFEKLDITPKSAQKIKPVLERWMKEAEERYASGQNHLTDFIGMEPSKKRKRRTSFTPQALELLNAHFERNTHPSGTEITGLAHQLGYEREVIRIWFCNKRQALKNTVRMMSKGMV